MLEQGVIKEKWHIVAFGRAKDYNQLLKPNLSGMVVFSSVIGYLMAPGTTFMWSDFGLWQKIITLFAGGMLITGSANTINQILERESDAKMKRTRLRPMPDGRMQATEAWIFAIITGLTGAFLLAFYFNLQASILGVISLLLYAFAYTPMKKIHPIAVFIGAIPGALPPFIGWVAATGTYSIGGWVLFLFQFFWQFPHFWAIAWVAFDDYKNAGICMLPTREKESRFTGLQCMVYSLILVPLAMVPRMLGMINNEAMWFCMFCGLLYFAASAVFYLKNDYKSARRVMFTSFFYLPAILLSFVFGKI